MYCSPLTMARPFMAETYQAPRAKNSKSLVVPDDAAVKIEDNSRLFITYVEVNPVEVSPNWLSAVPATMTAVGSEGTVRVPLAFAPVTWKRSVLPTSAIPG